MNLYREAMGWMMTTNLLTLLSLPIAISTHCILSDSKTCFSEQNSDQNERVNHVETHEPQTEESKVRQLYSAAKVIDAEYSHWGTKELVDNLRVLSTREFSSQPRPPTCDNCFRMDYPVVVMPEGLCSGDWRIDLLVQITTVPKEVEGRRVIRQTWGSLTRNNTASVKYMFLFGTGWSTEEQSIIEKEHEEFNDVLQHDYRDSYYNLTYKVVMGFTWAQEHCPDALFILRTATDNFINIPALARYLHHHPDQYQRTQIGRVHDQPTPRIRHRISKFYVPSHEYPYDHYPPYAIGSAFIYSMAAVAEILQAAPNIPHFALEDCWFGLLMEKINMVPTNMDGFDVVPNVEALGKVQAGVCPQEGQFFAVHIPTSFMIGHRLVEPHEFVSWLWLACAKFNMATDVL